MKMSSNFGCLWIALVSIAVMGCVGTPDEDIASEQDPNLTPSALTTNALTTNALTTNALTTNALTTNALTTNALTTNALLSSALEDPMAREILQYVVSCALPSNKSVSFSVEGQSYTYSGALGLAPEWGQPHGRCDQNCQEWVSGCLIARLDYLGVEREISIRGASPALAVTHREEAQYPFYEATYYGNVFQSPQVILGCLLPWQTADERVCGPSITDCTVEFTGDCLTNCDFITDDGAFPNCRDKPAWKHGATAYVGSVTVYLQPGEP